MPLDTHYVIHIKVERIDKDGITGRTVDEQVNVTVKRISLEDAIEHAQAVLDLELPKRKSTCRTCRSPVDIPGEQCGPCRASR